MVRIPAGTYQMGSAATERSRESDETAHSVTLTSDSYIGKTDVTQGQWQAVMGIADADVLRQLRDRGELPGLLRLVE